VLLRPRAHLRLCVAVSVLRARGEMSPRLTALHTGIRTQTIQPTRNQCHPHRRRVRGWVGQEGPSAAAGAQGRAPVECVPLRVLMPCYGLNVSHAVQLARSPFVVPSPLT